MRSLRELPRWVIILEAIGMSLLILVYLCINDYVTLPIILASPTIAIMMIFLAVGLMLPAATYIIWRVAQGFSPLLRISIPEKRNSKQDKNGKKTHKRQDDTD